MATEQMERIMEQYEVDASRSVIVSPGKFESEPIYVPYFWEQYLNGGADEDDGEVLVFQICDEDRAAFPGLLDDVAVVWLEATEQGFVYSREFKIGEPVPEL